MQASEKCIALIKESESCYLTPYQDVGGTWTDGYGNTHGVVEGKVITQAQANADLVGNVAVAAQAVVELVTIPLNQNQFDALTDFVFNEGREAFAESTLLRLLNAGSMEAAQLQFARWVYAKNANTGKKEIEPGLVTRRAKEAALFGTPITEVLLAKKKAAIPPTKASSTTTGKVSLGVVAAGASATIAQGVSSVQPAINAVHTASAATSGFPPLLKYIALGATLVVVGLGLITFLHKQNSL